MRMSEPDPVGAPFGVTDLSGSESEMESVIGDVACMSCGERKRDEHLMLLCDARGCKFACHTYCAHPPLTAIPEAKWFCGRCLPGDSRGAEAPPVRGALQRAITETCLRARRGCYNIADDTVFLAWDEWYQDEYGRDVRETFAGSSASQRMSLHREEAVAGFLLHTRACGRNHLAARLALRRHANAIGLCTRAFDAERVQLVSQGLSVEHPPTPRTPVVAATEPMLRRAARDAEDRSPSHRWQRLAALASLYTYALGSRASEVTHSRGKVVTGIDEALVNYEWATVEDRHSLRFSSLSVSSVGSGATVNLGYKDWDASQPWAPDAAYTEACSRADQLTVSVLSAKRRVKPRTILWSKTGAPRDSEEGLRDILISELVNHAVMNPHLPDDLVFALRTTQGRRRNVLKRLTTREWSSYTKELAAVEGLDPAFFTPGSWKSASASFGAIRGESPHVIAQRLDHRGLSSQHHYISGVVSDLAPPAFGIQTQAAQAEITRHRGGASAGPGPGGAGGSVGSSRASPPRRTGNRSSRGRGRPADPDAELL